MGGGSFVSDTCNGIVSVEIMLTRKYIPFKILASGVFLKYSKNFANFSLDIRTKHILTDSLACLL